MKRILVVDDEAGIRRSLRRILERAGYEVTEARNGQEAVRLWRDCPGHLVITDIHMPDKDGIETIIELRVLTPGIRIIAMSGGVQTKHLDLLGDAVLLGAVSTLEKPFSIQAALDAVRAILTEPQEDP